MPLVYTCLLALLLIATGVRAAQGRGLGLTRYRSAHGPWTVATGWVLAASGLALALVLALNRELVHWLWTGP
ncbi:MAG TPA: hypothetical protein VFF91_12865 [Pseudoxanthomonas sp.]|nr:hypothetical protein [Pseudoxanthomonas sp.]